MSNCYIKYVEYIISLKIYSIKFNCIYKLLFYFLLTRPVIIDIINVTLKIGGTKVGNKKQIDSGKIKTLQQQGTLNPSPQDVRDPLFLNEAFFDPNDIPLCQRSCRL